MPIQSKSGTEWDGVTLYYCKTCGTQLPKYFLHDATHDIVETKKNCFLCGKPLEATYHRIVTYNDGKEMHYACSMEYDQKIAREQFELKFCGNCNKTIESEWSYCPFCGQRFGDW